MEFLKINTNASHDPDRLKHIKGQEGRVDDIDKAEVMAYVQLRFHDISKWYEAYLSGPESFLEEFPLRDAAVDRYIELCALEEKLEEGETNVQKDGPEPLAVVRFGTPDEGGAIDPGYELAILEKHPAVQEYEKNPDAYLRDYPTTLKELRQLDYMRRKEISPEYIRKLGEIYAEVEGAVEDYKAVALTRSSKELKKDRRRSMANFLLSFVGAVLVDEKATRIEKVGGYGQSAGRMNLQIQMELAASIRDIANKTLHDRDGGDGEYVHGEMSHA